MKTWEQRYEDAADCIMVRCYPFTEYHVSYPIQGKDVFMGTRQDIKAAVRLVEKLDAVLDPRCPEIVCPEAF